MIPHRSQKPRKLRVSNASGKLVIIGILAVALAAAGISWWFRYDATWKTARFWGPDAARLIRDARQIEMLGVRTPDRLTALNIIERVSMDGKEYEVYFKRDISHARGISHFRNALLENRNYDWPADLPSDEITWYLILRFQNDSGPPLLVPFSRHEPRLGRWMEGETGIWNISCRPIADGLNELFDEFISQPNSPAR